MIGVWSFWSKPYLVGRKKVWLSERHHLLSWILSVQLARRHFCTTKLVTDEYGRRMLVDGLGLEFDEVQIVLNALDDHDPKWWALGKMYTYRLQDEPFIHIDSDVYLWKPLPVTLNTQVFAQNPEYFHLGASFYKPEVLAELMQMHGGWLPEQWHWYHSREGAQRAECCGVFGGHNIEFIKKYAGLAFSTIENSANCGVWNILDDGVERNILLEQYLLSACICHHNYFSLDGNPVFIEYLFSDEAAAFNPEKSASVGYTHLIANTKKSEIVGRNLENRVKNDYPEAYRRCLKYLEAC